MRRGRLGPPYGRLTAIVISAGLALHLVYSTYLQLVGDEAYYWLWSRHLDICYVDKGPMIAWLIRAGTSLFGTTEFGVRFFAVLLAAGTGGGLYLLGKELFSARVGFWTIVLAGVIPLFAVGASLMTIDTLYIFFWTWAAWAFWRARAGSDLRWWAMAGALVGLGILSKYTAALELLSFAVFCCWDKPSRNHLRMATFWLMLAIALLFFLPAIAWNIQHHWPTSRWLLQRGGLNHGFAFHPLYLFSFLGAQAGVLSPILFVGLLYILSRPALLREPQPATAYALSLFLPLFGFYLLLSIHYHEPPNWPAAAYIGGLLLLAAKGVQLCSTHTFARSAALVGLGLALLETGCLLETRWLHLPPKMDPLNRARGFRSLARSVERMEKVTGAEFVIADNYMTASLLSFYLPGHPTVFVPFTAHPTNQLEIWPTYDDVDPRGNGLIVSKRRKNPGTLAISFAQIEPLGSIAVIDNDRIVGRYQLFLARRLPEHAPSREQPNH